MDIKEVIDKVVADLQETPEKIKDFVADPGAAIEKITGHSLGDTDVAKVAEGVLSQIHEKGGDIKEDLSNLVENGAVHDIFSEIAEKGSELGSMLSGLFHKKD